MNGRDIRLGRLFSDRNRSVIIACDHGMFDGPHAGMEDLATMLQRVGDGPDAILLAPGMLRHTQAYFGRRQAPAAVVRINYNSVFAFHWGYRDAAISPLFDPADAVAMGADAVLVCVTLQTGCQQRDSRNAEIFADLCVKAHRLGLPVVGEYFPHSHLEKEAEAFHQEVLIGTRMLAELGADCIKTFYTHRFEEVTRTSPVPILGLGAEKTPTDRDALLLAEKQARAGAGGVVFGRNAVQATHPPAFIAALHEVVKGGLTAEEAARQFGLS